MQKQIQQNNLYNNHSGMGGPSTLGKFILVLLLVALLIFAYNKVANSNEKVIECTNNGGECVDDTCTFGKQVPFLSGTASGCKKHQLCCINVTRSEPEPDIECDEKEIGTPCEGKEGYYCDQAHKCIILCDFCSRYWGMKDFQTKTMCDKKSGDLEKFEKNSGKFSCSCTDTEAKSIQNKGLSMYNYCPSDKPNDSDYACCVPTK